MKTNGELLADVEEELEWEPEIDAEHIAVVVNDGAVTLFGHVPSLFDRSRAVEATHRVAGVVAVADEIEVRLPDDHERDDSDLAQTIAHLFNWTSTLPRDAIEATVAGGEVTLTGTVAHEFVAHEAVRLVERLVGVRGVTNLIATSAPADVAHVEKAVADALARDAAMAARHIRVDVDGTTAVLTGDVRTASEARVAAHAAARCPGIVAVDDRLVVGP
ncbi:MAG: BON domain-containing protein [Actinomycetota bacterium]|nr:BON domain-containing protein [Actinomycetota bacterium]